jgi:SET domain-containing protein
VFAIRPIPKGVNPLKSYIRMREIDVPKKDIKHLPKGVRNQIDMFCYYNRKTVSVPVNGLNSFDLAVYLNHSKQPNLRFKKVGVLVTLKAIDQGEELFIDYDISFGEKHYF